MTDICMSKSKVNKTSSKTSPSSRAARRRRIMLRRIKPALRYDSGAKRHKHEFPRDHINYFMNDEDSVEESSENEKTERAKAVLDNWAVLSLVDHRVEFYPKYGMASVCGRRRDMEDAVAIQPLVCGKRGVLGLHFFGVYDGHGCSHVATKCGERLHELVKEELENTGNNSDEWKNVMERSFAHMDKEVSNCKNNINIGSSSCRCELQYPESDTVGSTALTAVITTDKIIIANCGDSRAVLCRSGKPIPLSTDHKPDRLDELSRIQAAGGKVIYWDVPRVSEFSPCLELLVRPSYCYLKPYVSSEPEVTETDRTAEDDCLILASDGLWDVVSNETACEVACMCLKAENQTCSGEERLSGDGSRRSDKACSDASVLLMKLALSRRSSDNVTVVVIDLRRHM